MKTSAEQICDGRCFLPMRMCGRICAEKKAEPGDKKKGSPQDRFVSGAGK
mgnify:CR=1 FL=1